MTDVGSWSSVIATPVFAVHAALIYNPATTKWKAMLFAGGEEADFPPTGTGDLRRSALWDPETGSFSEQMFELLGPDDSADPFCAHQCFLPDGRLLVMGGAFYGGPDGRGIRASWTFDPSTETWTRLSDMAFERWYPTSVALPDGRVLVASGRSTVVIPEMEIFDPNTDSWATLPPSANKSMPIYPSLHVIPSGPLAGRVVYTGTRWANSTGTWSAPDTAVFDPGTNTWQDIASHIRPNRTEGFSVLLPPAECATVMVLGGGATASDAVIDSVEVMDLREATPTWRSVQELRHGRTNVNGVILPNGTVFVFGGHSSYKWSASGGGTDLHVRIPEIYDPRSEGWIEAAPMQQPRQYHSVGLLLPDGRVLCAGGVFPGTGDQFNMEIYSPPYMNASTRPAITSAPAQVTYGETFTVHTANSAEVAGVALIRPMAVTHHTDTEQRYVRASFHPSSATELSVTAPANPNLAPPGYYMLFIVDACGIPSVAKFVQVVPPTAKMPKDAKDLKDAEKPIPDKHKELKDKELKEWKDKDKELKEFKEKEFKELKEKDKDKDIFEGRPPGRHFIGPELRPDLRHAALRRDAEQVEPQPGTPDAKEPARPDRVGGKAALKKKRKAAKRKAKKKTTKKKTTKKKTTKKKTTKKKTGRKKGTRKT